MMLASIDLTTIKINLKRSVRSEIGNMHSICCKYRIIIEIQIKIWRTKYKLTKHWYFLFSIIEIFIVIVVT